MLGGLYEQDGGTEVIEENLLNIKTRVTEIASGEYGTGTVADRRFATHVGNLPPEAIDRLDLWFPDDSLEVQYSARGDGQRFRSIQEGSPGQKTAALLAFLLSYGDEPLILDQPEDDLDNHLIYDLIVTQLRGDSNAIGRSLWLRTMRISSSMAMPNWWWPSRRVAGKRRKSAKAAYRSNR